VTKKILLVEDDLPKLTQISEAVKAKDFELTVAKSINETIRRLDESIFDYVLPYQPSMKGLTYRLVDVNRTLEAVKF
jgi:DNA-binding response OmpR family regulator